MQTTAPEDLTSQLTDYFANLQHERQLSPHTLKNYQRDLNHLVTYCVLQELADWQSLTAQDIRL